MLRYTTDRATPGLVALYDIRPGNGVGQFLQPQSPHGAIRWWNEFGNVWIHLHTTPQHDRDASAKNKIHGMLTHDKSGSE